MPTIHGIGFNQARTDKRPGYADQLQLSLRDQLVGFLSENPDHPGTDSPLYVEATQGATPNWSALALTSL